jgi:hypothetical protein
VRTPSSLHLSAVALLAFGVAVPAVAAPQVTATSATVKLRPTAPVPPHAPVALLAARNEFVSFQVVVHGAGAGAANVTASLPFLEHPSGARLEGPDIALYRQGYLNLTKMSFADAAPGRYPDPLIPDVDEIAGEKRSAFPFAVPAGESRVIWVDILAAHDAVPGTYTGAVEVKGEGFQTSLPVTVNVLDTELPATSRLPSTFLFHRNLACRVHTGNPECGGESGSFALREKYQRMALEHRVTLSNVFTFPTSGDWAAFGARYTPWMEGGIATRLPGARMTTAQFHGPRTAEAFKAWEQYFGQRGWLDRAYDYTGDEPPWGISFSEALGRLKAVKAAAPGLRTLLTTTVQAADEYALTPYLDLVVPVVNHLEGTEAPYIGNQRRAYDAFLGEAGNDLWAYQSCMSHGCAFGSNMPENKPGQGWPSYMVDASAAKNRAMQWVLFSLEASGELYYETALALDTAWQDVFRFNGNGDGTLFYPGTPAQIGGTTHVPVASLRLKQIRQGMQDYEWLKKLEDAGDGAFARQVAASVAPSAFSVGDDGLAYDLARQKLINRWLDLQPPRAQPGGPGLVEGRIPGRGDEGAPGPGAVEEVPAQGSGGGVGTGAAAGRARRVTGKVGCAAGGPELAGALGLVGLLFALRRRSEF